MGKVSINQVIWSFSHLVSKRGTFSLRVRLRFRPPPKGTVGD